MRFRRIAAPALLAVLSAGWALSARRAPPAQAEPHAAPSPLHAYIPAACYAITRDRDGRVHNPCYVCHAQGRVPNFTNDADLQRAYDFPEPAADNPWPNLFAPASPVAGEPGDGELLSHIRTSNYFDRDGGIALARRLAAPRREWDQDGDGRWGGFVPDARFAFDERGFDRSGDGRYTGWRAFAYHPLPGAFLPTNGSADDVLIRLPAAFQEDQAGRFDRTIYEANLAIIEALISERDVATDSLDERRLGVDLDGDGRLGVARRIRYAWAPREGKTMSYVGRARQEQRAGRMPLAAGLYPPGTEFLHSVRYLDVAAGRVGLAARMKELRYARKRRWMTYAELEGRAQGEEHEARKHPDRLRQILGDVERGVSDEQGWLFQGFIEDRDGALRPQSLAESTTCVGCHGGLGVTTDSTFAFARKVPPSGFRRGWFHWTQRGLEGLPDPVRADGQGEYALYLQQVGGGDDFRGNDEVKARFFDEAGTLRPQALRDLRSDVSKLLVPSASRALALDRASWRRARAGDYVNGRDVVLGPVQNVHRRIEPGFGTGVAASIAPAWAAPSVSLAR